MLVCVDVNGHPHRIEPTSLLWSYSETTTLTAVSGSVSRGSMVVRWAAGCW